MKDISHRAYWFDHRTDVPEWVATAIGRIVVESAVLERELEEIIRLLLDTDIQNGRIITGGMNTRSRLTVITNLLQARVYHKDLKTDFLNDFIALATMISENVKSERDKVAHGLWDKINGKWNVLRYTGSRGIPEFSPEIKKVARSTLPQNEAMTPDKFKKIEDAIVRATDEIVVFGDRLEAALPPLQHKRPEYTRRRRQIRVRKKTAP